jgi:hypothetical protein
MFRKSLILLAALLLAVFALAGSAQAEGTPTPEPDHMHREGTPESDHHAEGTPEADHGHEHGERIDAHGAAVKIVAPQHNAVLDRDTVIVRVETTNWPLGEGKHWHLYLNGKEQGMSQGNSPALQARDLQPGENIIEVVLSNELHQELNATDMIAVRYEATGSAASTAAPALSSGIVIVLLGIVVAVAAILGIGFAVTRKKA